ncbi:MAG: hypothetical protein VCA37_01705 [Roseibacillus sp.]|jgi:hypothetical protein
MSKQESRRIISYTPAQQFKALHLDLEPQSLTIWSASGTDAGDRRAYLDDLLDAYLDLRATLDTNGYGWVPICADIPPAWDKMPLPDPASSLFRFL